jgi:hypothetical protein
VAPQIVQSILLRGGLLCADRWCGAAGGAGRAARRARRGGGGGGGDARPAPPWIPAAGPSLLTCRMVTTAAPPARRVPRLRAPQLAQFVADGFICLPGVLDPTLCAQVRSQMWEELSAAVPRVRRDDPSTWTAFTKEESRGEGAGQVPLSTRRPGPRFNNSHEGGDVRIECGPGHRFYVRNGCEETLLVLEYTDAPPRALRYPTRCSRASIQLVLSPDHLLRSDQDLFPRALFDVAEQLLGDGEVVWPRGVVNGRVSGPCFMSASAESSAATHTASQPRWPPPNATEEMEITATGPGFMNGQGTRGLYCTLPNSPDPRSQLRDDGRPYAAMHSDGGFESRVRLRATAFIDDCPPGSGGFTLWKASHTKVCVCQLGAWPGAGRGERIWWRGLIMFGADVATAVVERAAIQHGQRTQVSAGAGCGVAGRRA